MTFNNKVCIQYEIPERTRLFLILNYTRRNVRSYRKERDKKEDTTISRNKTSNKKRHTKKLRTRILKEIMDIPGR